MEEALTSAEAKAPTEDEAAIEAKAAAEAQATKKMTRPDGWSMPKRRHAGWQEELIPLAKVTHPKEWSTALI
jgi:hypothetical protein